MKLYDVIEGARQIYLIVERCKGIMLHNMVREMNQMGSIRKNLPEDMCAKIMYQLVSGLKFLHSLNYSHRDIKLENVLVDTETMQTKLIDFGFSNKSDFKD